MRSLTTRIALFITVLTGAFFQNLQAQSVLNPADPLITYDPNNPPAQPAFGQIGKWVRTVRLSWNTEKYKAYIYKGMAFRLHFPKTYNPTAIDGKKYPMLVFFHGHGEFGPIYDNEFHLLLGHQGFSDAINFGIYDGYVLSAQSTSYFGKEDYAKLMELIEYMIANNKLDPFHITANGLSQGGQATWEFLHDYPTYVSSGSSMSWTQYSYSESSFIDIVKYSPVWVFQGGQDVNPYPSITYQVRDAMLAAGAQFKLTEYPQAGHGTWWAAWSERDFWPFQKRSYSSNPWQLGGKIDFWPATPINATLGLAPGFSAYEWRKDGVLIAGASSNTLNVTQTGVYDARVQRNGLWSEWSRIPITIKYKTFTVLPGRVEAENWGAMGGTQKDYGVQTEWTGDGTSGLNVGWIDQGDWMEYNINPSSAGNYTVNLRVATPNSGAQLKIKKQDGTLLTTVNLPNTGGWQVWQTVSGVISLPAGNQIIKIESSAIPVWNFNWMDFTQGGVINQPPTANAGTDKTITLPTSSVSLSGSGTDADGTIASYAWTKVSGPAGSTITSPSSASTTVTGLAQGSYVFRLTVMDNQNATGTDDVTVTVNATASNTIHIEAENWSNMSGVQTETVFDAGGGLNVGWIEIGDWMEYTINPSSTANYTVNLRIATPNNGAQLQIKKADGTVLSTVNLPNTGAYQTWQTTSTTISLTAGSQTIRLQSSASPGWNINWLDLVQIGGNVSPSANAGSNQTITLPTSSVSLSGSGTDPDGTIASYAWSKISGPAGNTITSPSSASTTVTGLVQGVYTFRLTVTDNLGATGIDDVVITVNAAANQSPSANAGSNQTITLPTSSVSLSGSGTDPDGTIASYAWSKISGPAGNTITSPSSASTTVTGLVQGVYTFRLTVTDNLGATGIDDVVITVNAAGNQSPSANAGSNQTITLPTSSVSLSGSGTDPDGTISSYAWSKISGPAGNTITSPSSASTTVTGLVQGVYTFRLTVTDNLGATGIDDVVITVNAAANQSPSANAGSNQTITLPTSSVSLSGSGTDPDGTIASYAWSKISGPAGNTITSPSSASTTVTGLVQGIYTFRLTVTDNLGATGIDDVVITVNAPANQSPSANAGSDQTITLPTNSISLSGSGTDPDGTISSYAWSKISGPVQGNITSPSSASTTVTGLVQGIYTFRLTVTDNLGASGIDDVIVTVNAQPTPVYSLKIEAESYSSMSGVQTQSTQDAGGGLNVTGVDDNDWMDYSVNVPYSGTYTINFRIATTKGGNKFQLRSANGTVLATVSAPNTGGVQVWQTVSVTINLSQGQQTFRIFASKVTGSLNINWWEIILNSVSPVTRRTNAALQGDGEINSESSLEVFPSPVNDRFVLKMVNAFSGQVKVQILTLNGALQKEFTLNKTGIISQTNLSLGTLPKGIYMMVVQMKELKQTKKIIKL